MRDLHTENHHVVGQRVVVHQRLLFLKVRKQHIVDSWSTREFRLVRLLVNGLTQKHLAAKLEISPETVRSQNQTIFYKLRSNNLLQGPLPALQK